LSERWLTEVEERLDMAENLLMQTGLSSLLSQASMLRIIIFDGRDD
jgi:hypothetical protein